MGFLSSLFGGANISYNDMNCMSCKHLGKDTTGFYCKKSVISRPDVSDGRQFGFHDPYQYDESNNVILMQNNCEASYYWEARRLNSDGTPVLNDCSDVY